MCETDPSRGRLRTPEEKVPAFHYRSLFLQPSGSRAHEVFPKTAISLRRQYGHLTLNHQCGEPSDSLRPFIFSIENDNPSTHVIPFRLAIAIHLFSSEIIATDAAAQVDSGRLDPQCTGSKLFGRFHGIYATTLRSPSAGQAPAPVEGGQSLGLPSGSNCKVRYRARCQAGL